MKEKKKHFVAPPDLKRKLQELKVAEFDSTQCTAMLYVCQECGFKYYKENKDLTECPHCETPRARCKKLTVIGAKTCERHGGSGGRPIEVDAHDVPVKYQIDKFQRRARAKLKTISQITEDQALQCLTVSGMIEDALDPGTEGNYDIENLKDILKNSLEVFKALSTYEKNASLKKMADKMPDGNFYNPEALNLLKEALIKRAFAVAVNNFMDVMKTVLKDDVVIGNIFSKLIAPLRGAYESQDIYFESAATIAQKTRPDLIIEGITENGGRPVSEQQNPQGS